MIRLDKTGYSIVEPFLTEDNRRLPLLEDFIVQEKAADIYADSELSPEAFFILSKSSWAYLVGRKTAAFRKDILDFLYREQRDFYIWFGVDSSWIREGEGDSGRFELGNYPRYEFRFDRDQFFRNEKHDKRYQPRIIDRSNIAAACEFTGSIRDFYETPENFLKNGLGFVVTEGDRVIGEVVSASVSRSREAEMDIHTSEEYRAKGIGTSLGEAFIRTCLQKDLIPKWDCMVSNTASVKLADRLGFSVIKEYPVTCLVTNKKAGEP